MAGPGPRAARRNARTHEDEITELRSVVAQLHEEILLKDALIHDIDHRVKNTLQMAAGLLELHARRSGAPETRSALERAALRIVALAAAHAELNNADQNNLVRVDRYLASLCSALSAHEGGSPLVDVRCEEIACPPEIAIPIGLITSELVFNALKYAFPRDRDGVICVTLRRLPEHKAELEVRDDGVGRDPLAADGLGSRIVHVFAAQLKGQVEVRSAPEEGMSTRIRFDMRARYAPASRVDH